MSHSVFNSYHKSKTTNRHLYTHHRSNRQVPGYLESQDALKEAGIEEVIVYCVNDPAVMNVRDVEQFKPVDALQ